MKPYRPAPEFYKPKPAVKPAVDPMPANELEAVRNLAALGRKAAAQRMVDALDENSRVALLPLNAHVTATVLPVIVGSVASSEVQGSSRADVVDEPE